MIAICPTHEQLKSLTLGQLSEDQSDELISHVQRCESCQAEMGTLETAQDTLVGQLRSIEQDELCEGGNFQQEADCHLATARALAALASVETNRIDNSDGYWPLKQVPRSIGEYEIVKPLGNGGMGRVFLGRHTKLGRPVAIKVIADHRRWDRSMHDRFAAEMRFIGRLNHPNIVAASDAREVDGLAVLVTEFIDGLDVSEIIKRTGPLSVPDASAIICEVCKALQYIDSEGLVHRDIKPSNIMIAQDGSVKLLDLGLARLHPGDPEFGEFTATGQAMGTADYVAPEQIEDGRNVDARTDVYGLGCTFYKLLSGQAPFSGSRYPTAYSKMNAHVADQPLSLRDFRQDLPGEVVTLIEQMLSKDPADRPQTAEQVASRLTAFATSADLSALVTTSLETAEPKSMSMRSQSPRQKPKTQPERSWIGRHPLVATLIAAMMAMLFGLWLGITITIKKPDGTSTTVEIPDGSTAIVDSEGNIEIRLAAGAGQLRIPKESVTVDPAANNLLSSHADPTEVQPLDSNAAEPVTVETKPETFTIGKDEPIFDQVEAFDFVDLIGVPKPKMTEYQQQELAEAGIVTQIIASKKTITMMNRANLIKTISLDLTPAERKRLFDARAAGMNPQIEFHDPGRNLLADRIRMNGVWRTVLQRLGGAVTTDLPEQTILIVRNEAIRFDDDGIKRSKIELSQSGDQQTFTISSSEGPQTGVFRFLDNGRLEFAFNLDLTPVKSFDEAQLVWRLERVTTPETKFQKQAFEIIESAKMAQTKLEMYVANQRVDLPEDTLQAIRNAVDLREAEHDGQKLWLIGDSIFSNPDILAAEVTEQPGGQFGLLVQVTDAAGERMRIATTNNVGKMIAIVMDGTVRSTPRIAEPIKGNRFAVSGNFSREEAKTLAENIVPQLKLPEGVKISKASARQTSMQNLRLLAMAIHNYADAYNRFPSQTSSSDGTGNPPHSWRIAILPYLDGYEELYHEYRLDQAWDSEENLKVLAKMPAVFRHPLAPADSTATNYTLFVGENTAIIDRQDRKFSDLTDGTSNSLLLLEADTEIPWTKPEDLPLDKDWLHHLKRIDEDGLAIALADGSAIFIAKDYVVEEKLLPLILINDGKHIDVSKLQPRSARAPGGDQ